MPFNDNTRFWVVFDTCTIREYYQDVHNLIALPSGTTIRYEYREKYLSPAAVRAASNPETAPASVLLVYAQWNRYVRGNDAPPRSTPSSEILWVPTRFAEMQLIPPAEGANYFFDFKVLSYPKLDQTALMRILNPVITANEVPFNKWVCLSDDFQAFEALRRGTESENWQAIVDTLGTPPMQFSADTFMRLKGPFYGSRGGILPPKYKQEKQTVDNKMQVRKVISLYELVENEEYSFEVISHSPAPSSARAGAVIQRRLEVQPEKDGPIIVLGNPRLDLRQYTGQIIKFKAKRYEEMDQKTGSIRLDTGLLPDNWPVGANFLLLFRIKKKALKAIIALLTGVAAAVLLLFATKLWDKNPVFGVAAAVVGLFLTVITILLLTGKLSFKL